MKLKDVNEFFVQKVIGWALREYSRIEPVFAEKIIVNNNF
ncbi:MAG: DNA alkylation repair protein [Bacillota bacterium]